ncbi:hypothetical protein H6G49_09170 [Nostoc sp. PCC 7120 = FACHB-418]|nr:hypothetical protein [Anabaena cylindrica FACHB-318]MBD2263247.1 hypothetical protein [Anabaena sp. FACHB-709]MBD2272792.1 hypothetical protein [Nostoc sp. PCC 7120 = FACHB-418]MBD2283844.1 hypothetical protein [Anabaena cylindrica FACHB-170]MBD2348927.1 hypothetical protein [Trichormus variabilis FACHB-171]HBW28794.1 hypothetical protein [Nostoc sp. UBA8866]
MMRLHYNKTFGYMFIPLGLLNLTFGSILMVRGQFSISVIIGIIIIFLGWAYWHKPYITVEDKQFIIHTPLGWPQRVYGYNAPEDVKIAHKQILLKQDGEWKRLPISKLIMQPQDWLTLQKRFGEDRG